MKKLLLIVFILLLSVSNVSAAWLSGWENRKEITIDNTGNASELTNYQVKATVAYDSDMRYDFDDIRFTDSDGSTELDYWRESYTASSTADFWVEVPTVEASSNHTIYVYYGNSTLNDPLTVGIDASWERSANDEILQVGAGGAWDDHWVQIHSIVDNTATDGKYYAYYVGSQSDDVQKVGLATSTDGVTWTKDGSNPVLDVGSGGTWDDGRASYPMVWKEGSDWYMMYGGSSTSAQFEDIGLATSSDGITWTKDGSNPVMARGAGGTWDDEGMFPGTVMLKEGSTYYMYYCGFASMPIDFTDWKIGLATSTDLTTWTKSGNNPLLDGASLSWTDGLLEPHIKKFGSTYYMWYQGNSATADRSAIGLATSSSKDTGWTHSTVTPVLGNNPITNSWDDAWTEGPVLVDFGTEWRMYYGGSQGGAATPRMETGYAVYNKTGVGADTFLLFDDFYHSVIDVTTRWTNSGSFTWDRGLLTKYAANTNAQYLLISQASFTHPVIIEARAKVGADWSDEYGWNLVLLWDSAWATTGYLAGHYKDAGTDYHKIFEFDGGVAGDSDPTNESLTADTWINMLLSVGSTAQSYQINGVEKGAIATVPPTASTNIILSTGRTDATSTYTAYFDYVFAREFSDPEPSTSLGAEEISPAAMPTMYLPCMRPVPCKRK